MSAMLLKAQSLSPTVISSLGGFSESGDYSLSFTAGEAVTETFSANEHILTQGFQQPMLVSVSVRENEMNENFSVNAYPNPTSDKVFIDINSDMGEDLYLQLYDILGQKIQHPMHISMQSGNYVHELDLTGLSSGMYMVELKNESGLLKEVIRIQKIR